MNRKCHVLMVAAAVAWCGGARSAPTAKSPAGKPAPVVKAKPVTKPRPKPTLRPVIKPTPAPEPIRMPMNPEDSNDPAMLTNLLFQGSPNEAAFTALTQRAAAAGVSANLIFEATFLNQIRGEDTEAIAAFLPRLKDYQQRYDDKQTRLFQTAATLNGMIVGVQALTKWQQGMNAEFETGIKDAFWTTPGLAQLFGAWVSEYRRQQAMSKITFPFETKLKTSEGGEAMLKDLLADHQALLLDFWASWCRPCQVSIPNLPAKAEAIRKQGVLMVGINTEGDAQIASMVQKTYKIIFPWLVEPQNGELSRLLMVESLPRTVLISREGKILFNGHPDAPKLSRILQGLPTPPTAPAQG